MSFLQKLRVPHDENELPPTFLISHDVKPIEQERRTWGWLAFLSLWSTIAFNMTNFQIGSSLLALGLNWWQTFLATLLGHTLAAVLIVLGSYPGLYYKISFPIATRIAWGFYGSIFVVINRILLSVIWFGVQAWQGGLVTYVCLRAMWPSIDRIPNTIPASTGMNLPQFIGFTVFYLLSLPLLLLSPKQLRYLVYLSSVTGFIVQLVLVIWACTTMSSFGSILRNSTSLPASELGWMFVFGTSATMSSITSGTVSICDYTRFAKRPSSGTWSQFLGAIPSWLSNVFGVLTIAATQERYGSELWSVASLLMAIQDANPTPATRAAVWFAGFTFAVNQVVLNVVGNSFAGGCDLTALFPKYINIRRGQFLTAILGLVINPWYLLSGAVVFISAMSAYTIFLQPFLGVLLAHYFVLYRQRVMVRDLYKMGTGTVYWYGCGLNWRAVVAWLAGSIPHLAGFLNTVNPRIGVSKGSLRLYYMSSITAFLFSFTTSLILGYLFPAAEPVAFSASVTRREADDLLEEFILDLKTDSVVIESQEGEKGSVNGDEKEEDRKRE